LATNQGVGRSNRSGRTSKTSIEANLRIGFFVFCGEIWFSFTNLFLTLGYLKCFVSPENGNQALVAVIFGA
jgi:hypothetical protein